MIKRITLIAGLIASLSFSHLTLSETTEEDYFNTGNWAEGDIAGSKPTDDRYKNHTITTTLTRNKHYELTILLPQSYSAKQSKHYPVLYLLDPYWDLVMIEHIVNALIYDQYMPEIIVVGIGYPGDNYHELRQFDYTPVVSELDKNSGDANAFLTFITNEVIPLTESTYRVDTSFRALGGGSLGGLFSLYAMLERPTLFQGHISSSPAIMWGYRHIIQKEARFFQDGSKELWLDSSTRALPTRLFMTVGSDETEFNWKHEAEAFYSLIQHRSYAGFHSEFHSLDGYHHGGIKFPTYTLGLPYIFKEYRNL